MARWGLRHSIAIALVAATACTTRSDSYTDSLERGGNDVISAGYRYIASRYIRSVPARDLAKAGLKGMTLLDPDFKTEFKKSQIVVRNGKAVVALFRAPAPTDSIAWARTTVRVLLAARTKSAKIRNAPAEEVYQAVFTSAIKSLDKYSRYSSAAEARDSRAWREGYGGIGITIRAEKGQTRILSVMPKTPGAKAGLKARDIIVRIGGTAIKDWKLRAVVQKLRGPRGSYVRLAIRRTGRARLVGINVQRRFIIPQTVTYKRQGSAAYIKVHRFSLGTARRVARAVLRGRREIGRKMTGIILDLRDNPGGLLDQSVVMSDLFLNSGKILQTRGRHPDSLQSYNARAGDIAQGLPMVVLINGRSASSAEIVAAALQDNGRAVLVGSTSFGKGTVQSVVSLPNQGELILTWSRFYSPSGYALEGLGVLPNLCTSRGARTAASVVGRVNRHTTRPESVFRKWRGVSIPSKTRNAALRRLCPPQTTSGPFDLELEIARRLLNKRPLYQQTLRLTSFKYRQRSALPKVHAASTRK
jgi:carboxyl-terminal processing protease